MELPTQILLTYGYLLLFAWVFVEQLGVPLPATPVLLAAGALTAQGQLSLPAALMAALVAALIADTAWYYVGRRYGHMVLRILCKLSLEPTVCVRQTQNSYSQGRAFTLVIAKFVPGLATLAPPVAGQNGMALAPFLFFDGIGSLLWVGVLLVAGRLFGDALRRDPSLLDVAERFSGALLLAAVVVVEIHFAVFGRRRGCCCRKNKKKNIFSLSAQLSTIAYIFIYLFI